MKRNNNNGMSYNSTNVKLLKIKVSSMYLLTYHRRITSNSKKSQPNNRVIRISLM